jgi:hypothetical protein
VTAVHPASIPIEQLLRDVEFRTTRGPGPGGQHRNKSDTMVRLTHRPTGIHSQAGERRSLDLNKSIALHRLRVALALQHRSAVEEPGPSALFEPSATWRSRVRGGLLRVNPRHEDFPALLAETLDLLAHVGDELPRAARLLGVTSSQLVRFLGLEPAALAAINARRKAAGMAPLR